MWREQKVGVGSTVALLGKGMTGIVIKESPYVAGMFYINYWNHKLKIYEETVRCPFELRAIPAHYFTPEPREYNKEAQEFYRDVVIELSINTKDKDWFDEVNPRIGAVDVFSKEDQEWFNSLANRKEFG